MPRSFLAKLSNTTCEHVGKMRAGCDTIERNGSDGAPLSMRQGSTCHRPWYQVAHRHIGRRRRHSEAWRATACSARIWLGDACTAAGCRTHTGPSSNTCRTLVAAQMVSAVRAEPPRSSSCPSAGGIGRSPVGRAAGCMRREVARQRSAMVCMLNHTDLDGIDAGLRPQPLHIPLRVTVCTDGRATLQNNERLRRTARRPRIGGVESPQRCGRKALAAVAQNAVRTGAR